MKRAAMKRKGSERMDLSQMIVGDLLSELRKRFVGKYAMTDDVPGMTLRLIGEVMKGEGPAGTWGPVDKETLVPILKGFQLGAKDEKIVYFCEKDLSSGGIEGKL